jgi:hypothetical protein
MIVNNLIDPKTFSDLMKMYERQNIQVSKKVLNQSYVSYVVEGVQHLYIDDLSLFPIELLESIDFNSSGIKDEKIGDSTISYRSEEDGSVHLFSLRTPSTKRGKGSARKAMEEFLSKADEENKIVYLEAAALDKRTSTYKLVQFYKSLGFVETGKTINALGEPEMKRMPKSTSNKVNESVELIAKDFIKCHGKKPSGVGSWIFGIGSKKPEDWFEVKGKFSVAQKKAIAKAEKESKSKVFVMEDLSSEFHEVNYSIKKESIGHRISLVVEGVEKNVTNTITEEAAINTGKRWVLKTLQERSLSKSEYKEREKVVKGMKSKISDFKKRYGDKAKSVMYGTATNIAKESFDEIEEEFKETSENELRFPYKSIKFKNDNNEDVYRIVDNLDQALAGTYSKEEADDIVKTFNSMSKIETHSLKESVKTFEIKYSIKDEDETIEGTKKYQAPDESTARTRFTEDNKDTPGVTINSITEI